MADARVVPISSLIVPRKVGLRLCVETELAEPEIDFAGREGALGFDCIGGWQLRSLVALAEELCEPAIAVDGGGAAALGGAVQAMVAGDDGEFSGAECFLMSSSIRLSASVSREAKMMVRPW